MPTTRRLSVKYIKITTRLFPGAGIDAILHIIHEASLDKGERGGKRFVITIRPAKTKRRKVR
jgi:hypothetical protein